MKMKILPKINFAQTTKKFSFEFAVNLNDCKKYKKLTIETKTFSLIFIKRTDYCRVD